VGKLRYLFEDLSLDTDCRELRRGADAVSVEPQVFDLLVYLIRNRERVVSRDDLLASVWQGRLVSESALNTRIHLARSAIGDSGEDQRLIKTFPRKGIRFVGPVREDSQVADAVPDQVGAGVQRTEVAANGQVLRSTEEHAAASTAESPSTENLMARAAGEPWIARRLARWLFEARLARPRTAAATSAAKAGAATIETATGGDGPLAGPAYERAMLPSGLIVLALSTVLAVGFWMIWPPQRDATPAPSVLTMMAAPSIAVFPFTTLGSQGEPRSLAAGLEAEVRSELARVHRGFDLTINSASDDRGAPASPRMTPAARYAVVGTTWLERNVQRANIQLIETETNRQLWSEPFEFDRGQSSAINRVAARIARLLIIQVRTAESQRPLPAELEAGHYVLQGRALHETERGPKSTTEAHSLFKKALQLNGDSIVALQGFATTRLIQVHNMWVPWEQHPTALVEAGDAIERLVQLDAGNAAGHYLRASLLRARGEPDRAIASLQHALSLNPNYYPAHAELGRIKIDAGRAHEAIGHIQEALELNPPEPNIHVLYFWAGMAAVHTADYPVAVQWLLKARQANPAFRFSDQWLAVAYLGAGDEGQARAGMAEYLKAAPKFSIATWKRTMATRNPIVAKQRERIVDALRRLGAPEGEGTVAN
jgi:DNA-binding winged helix-turn-helix (wHTH) protein/tetratricopeptide (TPR) repeat protein